MTAHAEAAPTAAPVLTDFDAAINAAHRFYGKHRGEHLSRDSALLVQRCQQHLIDLLPLADRRAARIAMQVWAEIDSQGAPGFIPADLCTSYLVVVHDNASNTRHMLTLTDLLAYVRQRPTAPR